MQNTTICLIDTLTLDKVWIGKDDSFSSISIGIQFADGRVWDGETICKDQLSHDAYIHKVWQIAVLFSTVWLHIDPVQGNFALSACKSAMQEDKLPFEIKKVEELAKYVLDLESKIKRAITEPMPQEYIDACRKARITYHTMIELEPDMID